MILEKGIILPQVKVSNDKPILMTGSGSPDRAAYSLAVLVFLLAKCFYFQFTTQLNSKPYFSELNVRMYFSSFGIILIIVSIIMMVFNKKMNYALFFLDIVLSIVLLADTLYYRYYYNAITIPVLYQISFVGAIKKSALSLTNYSDVIYMLDLPFLAAALVILRKKLLQKTEIRKKLILFTAMACTGLASVTGAYSTAQTDSFIYDNNYVANNLGVFYFHYYDIKRFVTNNLLEDRNLAAEEKAGIDSYFSSKGDKSTGKYIGAAEGKNLIMVQIEAFQSFLIGKKIGDTEITPNINKLLKESLYFNNFHYQIGGGNTSDAEFLSNTSLYPLKDGAVYFRFPSNTYYTLPKMLKDQGYKTYAFHANSPSFWNRAVMYNSIGFDNFFSANNFKKDEIIGWGVSDESFFRQSLDKIDTSSPFYGFMITLSSHHPFSYFEKLGFNSGKYEGTLFGDYMKAVNYVDRSIGTLISELKKRGLYDNTLLVMYGDHFGIPKGQMNDALDFLGIENNELELTKLQEIPLIIHCPGISGGEEISTTGGEIDIRPTIAGLMNLKAPYAMGKNLLGSESGYAVLRNGSLITDRYYYSNDTDSAYDISTGAKLSKDEFSSEIEALRNELRISDLIVEKNAFKSK
jgi:phosphoglycerol transferase MdoB-like AlkP superfamily enzyme